MAAKRSDPIYQAQAILSRRDHSVSEVRRKLAHKGFSGQDIAKAIAWLTDHRLLDEAKFARVYSESLLRRKLVGPRYLKAKLVQRGVAAKIIQQVVADAFAGSQEVELARQAARRWVGRQQPDRVRLYRFLLGRGFSPSVIDTVLGEAVQGE